MNAVLALFIFAIGCFVVAHLIRAQRSEFSRKRDDAPEYTLVNYERVEDDDWMLWIKPADGTTFRVKGSPTVWHHYPSGTSCGTRLDRIFSDMAEGIVMQERERSLAKRGPVTIDAQTVHDMPTLDELWEAAERIGTAVEVGTGFGRKDYRGRVNCKIGGSTVLCYGEGTTPRQALANAIAEAIRRGALP